MKYREALDPRKRYGEALLEMAAYLLAMEDLKRAEQPLSEAEERLLEAQYRRTQPEMGHHLRAAERRQGWRSMARKRIPQVLKVAAILILVLNLSVAVACAVNEAVRAHVLKFMFTIRTECTELSFAPTGETVEVPPEWTFNFYPTYIPEGYTLFDVAVTGDIETVTYIKDEDRYVRIRVASKQAESSVDTEDSRIFWSRIHGQQAMIAEKGGRAMIVWPEGEWFFAVVVNGREEPIEQTRAEAIKIAESFSVIEREMQPVD